MRKLDKRFVSEIDKKLAAFDQNHQKSAAQKAEVEKYQRIYQLRDSAKRAASDADADALWE